jgi:hypothetical protein
MIEFMPICQHCKKEIKDRLVAVSLNNKFYHADCLNKTKWGKKIDREFKGFIKNLNKPMPKIKDWKKKFKKKYENIAVPYKEVEAFVEELLEEQAKGMVRFGDISAWRKFGEEAGYWKYFSGEGFTELRKEQEIKLPKIEEHICRFNDGEQKCECFNKCLDEVIKLNNIK